MDKPKLTLIQGGKGKDVAPTAERKRFLYERMSRADRVRERIYVKISMSSTSWLPFHVKLWAIRKLGALHGKYDYPGEEDFTKIANYR